MVGDRNLKTDEINALESESGVIATLLHHPDYIFYSEQLLPNHFTEQTNCAVYCAIRTLVEKGIYKIDTFNILEALNSSSTTKHYAESLTVDGLNELIEISGVIARSSVQEYQMLVSKIIDAAFRREAITVLQDCERLCLYGGDDIQQEIYGRIDRIMLDYSSSNEIPSYGDVIDDCWEEIKSRQNNGYSGIPFKFKTLNEFATLERGELFIFAAEAKQGKSMMLLNCAVDLLKQGYSVLYLDSELNTRLFTARLLSHLSGIEYKRLTAGAYTETEAEKIDQARDWMKSRKFTHIYMPIFDQQGIYTTVKKVFHTQGIDVLIVDYFKSSADGDAFNSYQELGKLTDLVKNKICGDMGICGLGAAQATASGKIADSAKIGRNASTIAMLQDKTQNEIEADGEECGNKKLRVVLNRNGMQHATGEYIDMIFNGNLISYEEAKQHIPEIPY